MKTINSATLTLLLLLTPASGISLRQKAMNQQRLFLENNLQNQLWKSNDWHFLDVNKFFGMKSEMVDHSKLIQLFDDIEMKDSDEQLTEVNEQASGEIEVENTDKAQAETKEQPTEQETTQTDE